MGSRFISYCRRKRALLALITISVVLLFFVHNETQNPSQPRRVATVASEVHVTVEIIGTNHTEKAQERFGNGQKGYVFVLPNKIEAIQKTHSGAVHHLTQILNAFSQFDGATCFSTRDNKSNNNKRQKIKTCWFETKNWTVIIKNGSSRVQQYNMFHRNVSFSICNIVEVPFVIRRAVLNKIDLRPSHGGATFLDFFLRSNAKLKIAASHDCNFVTDGQLKTDPGATSHSDYGLFGYHHNILRIVREDSITWTKCSLINAACPDKPEQNTPSKNILSTYCCKARLSRVLVDTVDAMNQIGMGYRVCFGTLLGAVRTKTIIPWTADIDICVKLSDYKNRQAFKKLESILKPKGYSSSVILGLRRVVPVSPLVTHIPNSSALSESNLFRQEVLEMMQDMLPIQKPQWNSFAYADIYSYDEIFKTDISNVSIDGRDYLTGHNPHLLLTGWFGKGYMSTDEKDRKESDSVTVPSVE